MKNLKWYIVLSLLTVIPVCVFSCKKAIKSRQDLIAYVNDPENGLKKEEQIGNVKAVLTYKPWQMMALNQQKQAGENGNAVNINIKERLFFVLSLSANNKELIRQLPFSQYSEMVQLLAFRMQEFIEVVADGGKPIAPLECIFQQTYGMGVANNLLIVFDRGSLIKANSLKFQVKEFGLNLGNLKFEMETQDIKNILNITIN